MTRSHLLVLALVAAGQVISQTQAAIPGQTAESRQVININPAWRFWLGEPAGDPFRTDFDDSSWDLVSLPHTMEVFPADLENFEARGRNLGWYRRTINVPAGWLQKKVFLHFQGAMQTTRLWVNGNYVGEHALSGYDSFHFDITPQLKAGTNVIAVRVDNTVNPDIPPDGQWMDFILFGGLYRDVNLVVTDPLYVTFPWEARQAGVRLTLPEVSAERAVLQAESTVRNASGKPRNCTLVTEVRDGKGTLVVSMTDTREIAAGSESTFTQKSEPIAKPRLWSPDDPYLYQVNTIVRENEKEVDRISNRLGVRWFKFDKEKGFFLNGQHLKLIGVNCHQTWPFIGNAVPNGLHRRDAEQIKAMGVNWVRLSHYPHDPDFLDDLDELGLMALEEGPTWMNAGNAKWLDNLEKTFRSMIRRDRNHPCIIIWNACINHSRGNPALAQAAAEEDPTRPRGQVDVPCPMDFQHGHVSGNGALTIEHTGHTFPAYRGERGSVGYHDKDWEGAQTSANRELDLARWHWEQTDAAYRQQDNSGQSVWCMYDYNSFHNSTDGKTFHGVCDLFRIPKYTYWWHQSELTSKRMAYIVRSDPDKVWVFSNCRQVRLWQDVGKGYKQLVVQEPDSGFVLHHPPFHFAVSTQAIAFKAEGLINGAVKAVAEWKTPGKPAALTLEADRPVITADGADLSRVIVMAVDEKGTALDDCEAPVSFSIEGLGQLVGENPAKLRAGKMIILAQSAFVPGKMTVRASAEGMRPASVEVTTVAPVEGVDMPKNLALKQPTRSNRVVLPPAINVEEQPWLEFKARTDVPRNTWIESNPIMIPGELKQVAIEIRGGEYRIYTGEWTDQPGHVISGDAVFVRVKSPARGDSDAWAEVTIGKFKTRFEVKTGRN
jgi:beta-galactosidase